MEPNKEISSESVEPSPQVGNGSEVIMNDTETEESELQPFPWHVGICDAHCHPTDIMSSVDHIPNMKAETLTVMSTRSQDQELVEGMMEWLAFKVKDKKSGESSNSDESDAGSCHGGKVIPAFGWHPWFSHQIYDDRPLHNQNNPVDKKEHYKRVLTNEAADDDAFLDSLVSPIPLTRFLRDTQDRLVRFPTALVGEIGLDKTFRLPEGPSAMTGGVSMKTGGDTGAYTPGSREGRPLTTYKVDMQHQVKIFQAQLKLAAKHQRPVSVHSVQAHGVVFDTMRRLWEGHERPSKREAKKRKDAVNAINDNNEGEKEPPPFPPRICMHSYSGPPDALRWFLDPRVPVDFYFSFSECINFSDKSPPKAIDVIATLPEDRILVESDLHCAGEPMDELLEDIVRRVCEIRRWELEEGAKILKRNWQRFVFGG